MMEPRGQLRLPHGAAASDLELPRIRMRRPDDFLDCHITAEQFIVGPPDSTHPAATDNLTKPVSPGKKTFWLRHGHFSQLPGNGAM
jgi:hypothetical protein